ncbi:hypothetical protein ACFLTH_01855 [Bacteroidota bacterium]
MNLAMKNFLILFIILSFTACEKITDDVIESQFLNNSVVNINAPDEFNYSEINRDFIVTIELSNPDQVEQVWFNIITSDGNERIAEAVLMTDDGNLQSSGDAAANDNIYSGKFTFTDEIVAGEYLVEFYIEDNVNFDPQNIRKVASHLFNLSTGEANEPPLIFDLIMQNAVTRDVSFIFSVKATDPNGDADIASVYYEMYKPDGTQQVNSQGMSQFPLYDNGDVSGTGDLTAGDGRYSFKLTFPVEIETGSWEFRFYAQDRSGALSNIISHNIEVN